jgi:uncharacterized membrane protein
VPLLNSKEGWIIAKTVSESRAGDIQSPEDHRQQESLDRLTNFSDGIFAFAMTLLALDLVTPVIVGQPTDASLSVALANEFHSFLGFLVSFWVITGLWVSHHRIFSYIRRMDSGLLRLNMAYFSSCSSLLQRES